ncbi:MAG: response regulator transcription factor [Gammaproteobacteria bacterium]
MRLLLVEDDSRIVEFLRRGLQAEGYELDVAVDGPRGLELGESAAYAVIILDIMLPGLSGREVCRRLRETGITTPILMLTALDAIDDKVAGLRTGADDYLPKPFAFAELLARVGALLRRRGRYEPYGVTLKVGELILNRATREVKRGDRTIELTPKEFALLEYLMSNPNTVLSRTQILEAAWGADSDPMTNVVDVYIRHLRRKIDAGQAQPLIHTLRGFGYKLLAPGEQRSGAPPRGNATPE